MISFPLEKTGRTTDCEFVGDETGILVSMTSLKYLGSMPLKSIITYIGYLGLHQYFSHPLILNLHISSPIYKFESETLKLWETINSKASESSIVERLCHTNGLNNLVNPKQDLNCEMTFSNHHIICKYILKSFLKPNLQVFTVSHSKHALIMCGWGCHVPANYPIYP
jgi:hypothetical protein